MSKIRGRVEHRDLEGGIWLLASDDGKRYTLIGAPKDLRVAGARVEIEGSIDEGGMGIAMSGPQLHVRKFEKL